MMKTFLLRTFCLLACLLLAPAVLRAQQDPMYTMYVFNKLPLNAAYAGSTGKISATLLHRTQWAGFEGAPRTSAFSIHAPFFKEKSGIGLAIVHDRLGIQENLSLSGQYAYRIDLGGSRLAMGLSGEIQRQQMRWNNTNPLQQLDPGIPFTNDNLFLPNFGAGIYWDSDRFFAGLSVPRLLENKLDYTGGQAGFTTVQARQSRHYLLMAGAMFEVSHEIKLRPSAMARYTANAPVTVDMNLSALLYDVLWVGGGYRVGDAFNLMAVLQLKGWMQVGYSHDFTHTRLNAYHNGTHEIILTMDLGKRAKGLYHPRYF